MRNTTDEDLDALNTRALQARFAEVIGTPTTNRNRTHMIQRIRSVLAHQAKVPAPPSPTATAPEADVGPAAQAESAAANTVAPAPEDATPPPEDSPKPSPPTAATSDAERPPTEKAAEATAPPSVKAGRRAPGKTVAAKRTRRRVVPADGRDPRLPVPGTVITREFGGKTHKVTVHEADFEYKRTRWKSLSALARHISGSIWNGLLFFKLIPYARRPKQAA